MESYEEFLRGNIGKLNKCVDAQGLVISQTVAENEALKKRVSILEERIDAQIKWMDWERFSMEEETRLKLLHQANKYETTIKGMISEKKSEPQDPNKSPLL